jgi:hypothetical protein
VTDVAPAESVATAIPCPRPACGAGIGQPCVNPRTLARAACARPHIERYEEWRRQPAAAVVVEVAAARMRWDTNDDLPVLDTLSRAELIRTAAACVALAERRTA